MLVTRSVQPHRVDHGGANASVVQNAVGNMLRNGVEDLVVLLPAGMSIRPATETVGGTVSAPHTPRGTPMPQAISAAASIR